MDSDQLPIGASPQPPAKPRFPGDRGKGADVKLDNIAKPTDLAPPDVSPVLPEIQRPGGPMPTLEQYAPPTVTPIGGQGGTQGVGPSGAQPMKRWTVTAPDGTTYPGVLAPTMEEAIRKMQHGPQGPLQPSRSPQDETSPTGATRPKAGDIVGPGDILGPLAGMAAGGPAGIAAGGLMEFLTKGEGKEAAGAAVPAVVGALMKPGRTIPRVLGPMLGNILGRGALEAGTEAINPTGKGPLQAGLEGGMKGVLPGVAQGALGAILGPSKATINVERAARAMKADLSPEVAAVLNPSKPAEVLSRATPKAMTDAAGKNLDRAEAEIGKKLGDLRFTTVGPLAQGLKMTPAQQTAFDAMSPAAQAQVRAQMAPAVGAGSQGKTFDEIRSEIKSLREQGKFNRETTPEKALAARKQANALEQTMLAQMPPDVAQQYRMMTAQHQRDMDAVRLLEGFQKQNRLIGGANPVDRPALAEAQKALTSGGKGSAAIHGLIGTAEAATGHGLGAAYHLGRAAQGVGRSILRPGKTSSVAVPRITGALGGGAVSAGQTAIGQSNAYKEDQ